MKTVILKYNAGNIRSVQIALERLGITPMISDDPQVILSADRVIFPGVGEASSAMIHLKERNLDRLIRDLKQPVLGICLGMQLMCTHSEEGDTDCLNIFRGSVKKFRIDQENQFKVPQIGWNSIRSLKGPLFRGIREEEYMYFVHGFFVEKNEYAVAETEYSERYCSAMNRGNFYAVQFHPEKSAKAGERLLSNFLNI